MRKAVSRPRPHKLTGPAERARIGEKICQHNQWYWGKSGPGAERLVDDTSGHFDVTQLANAPDKGSER
jgi:hypothetical protein